MTMYMHLLAKMVEDSPSIMFAKVNFELLYDIKLFIFFFGLLLMLEIVHALIMFAQKKDVFVCDYVVAINIYPG